MSHPLLVSGSLFQSSLTLTKDVDRIDPRGLLILLIALYQDMQTPDILESDESQFQLLSLDILS